MTFSIFARQAGMARSDAAPTYLAQGVQRIGRHQTYRANRSFQRAVNSDPNLAVPIARVCISAGHPHLALHVLQRSRAPRDHHSKHDFFESLAQAHHNLAHSNGTFSQKHNDAEIDALESASNLGIGEQVLPKHVELMQAFAERYCHQTYGVCYKVFLGGVRHKKNNVSNTRFLNDVLESCAVGLRAGAYSAVGFLKNLLFAEEIRDGLIKATVNLQVVPAIAIYLSQTQIDAERRNALHVLRRLQCLDWARRSVETAVTKYHLNLPTYEPSAARQPVAKAGFSEPIYRCEDERRPLYHLSLPLSTQLYNIGVSIHDQPSCHQAIKQYDAYIARDFADAWAYIYRGQANVFAKRYDAAQKDFSRSLRYWPSTIAVVNKGLCDMERGDFDQAIVHFRHVAAQDTSDLTAAFGWGECLRQQGHDEEAVAVLRRGLEHPHNIEDLPLALASLGHALMALDKAAEALDYYDRSLRVEDSAQTHLAKYEALIALKDPTLAQEALRHAISAGSSSEEVRAADARIASRENSARIGADNSRVTIAKVATLSG